MAETPGERRREHRPENLPLRLAHLASRGRSCSSFALSLSLSLSLSALCRSQTPPLLLFFYMFFFGFCPFLLLFFCLTTPHALYPSPSACFRTSFSALSFWTGLERSSTSARWPGPTARQHIFEPKAPLKYISSARVFDHLGVFQSWPHMATWPNIRNPLSPLLAPMGLFLKAIA